MELIRIKEQEEPNRNLIFWFEDKDSDMVVSVFNEEGNAHARIVNGLECIKVGYPFAHITQDDEVKIRESIERFIIRNKVK